MRKLIFLAILPLLCSALIPVDDKDPKVLTSALTPRDFSSLVTLEEQYKKLDIPGVISYDAYAKACEGYNKIPHIRRHILTLIDFTKPSNQPRLAVIDMERNTVLYTSLVAHGRNSGEMYATAFSNRNGSYQSSLGFYLTGSTYTGSNGYSLKLIGLEKGFNDRALERAIVIHGANYCDPSVVSRGARLGRSLGCPALPLQVSRPIIDAIKDGSVLFIYASDKNYLAGSPLIGQHEDPTT